MIRFIVGVCLAIVPLAAAPDVNLSEVLRAVENHYNRAKTLQVAFQQKYIQGRAQRSESGELFLRKPGRMRWQYTNPAGKLFVSDGKFTYLYSPANNRVEKSKLRETDDTRAPLAFLLGKLDFNRDFKRYTYRKEGDSLWITAQPRSDKLPYSEISFLVDPAYEIRKVQVTGQDQSVMEFTFSNEKVNPPLAAKLFEFQPPAGAEVVQPLGETAGQ